MSYRPTPVTNSRFGFSPTSPATTRRRSLFRRRWSSIRRIHEDTVQLRQGRGGHLRRHGRSGPVPQHVWAGRIAAPPRSTPCFSDQRLRLLPGYALEGPARDRGDGTAIVLTGRVARIPVLHRS